jgi:hypothetical protein
MKKEGSAISTAVPAAYFLACPRCHFTRSFMMLDNVTGRCSGCEWTFSLAAQSPTGTGTAVLNAGGTAITVVSGGVSFTNGMRLLYDTAQNAEVLTVNGSASATNIPVTAAVRGHSASVTFGQLLISSTYSGLGQAQVPAAAPYGF